MTIDTDIPVNNSSDAFPLESEAILAPEGEQTGQPPIDGKQVIRVLRSLEQLLSEPRQLNDVDVDVMDRYLSGETASTIATELSLDSKEVKRNIDRTLAAIGLGASMQDTLAQKQRLRFTKTIYHPESLEGLSAGQLIRKIAEDYPDIADRERQYLFLLFEGKTYEEIAASMSVKTASARAAIGIIRSNIKNVISVEQASSDDERMVITEFSSQQLVEKWSELFGLDEAFTRPLTSFLSSTPLIEPANQQETLSVRTLSYGLKKHVPDLNTPEVGLSNEERFFIEELLGWYSDVVRLKREPIPLRVLLYRAKRESRDFVQATVMSGLGKLYQVAAKSTSKQ